MRLGMWNFAQINHQINRVSLGALEDAYQAAIAIKQIEDKHFGGKPIGHQPEQGKTVGDYFRTQLDRQLLKVRSSLLRFKITGFLTNHQMLSQDPDSLDEGPASEQPVEAIAPAEAEVLEKLKFIESVVGKYRTYEDLFGNSQDSTADPQPAITPEVLAPDSEDISAKATNDLTGPGKSPGQLRNADPPKDLLAKVKSGKAYRPTRSNRMFGGLSQVRKEFSPKYEQEVIQELRIRRRQNRAAIRWLAVLLIVPIVAQVVTKNLILNPVLGSYSERNPSKIELSRGIEEEFLHEFTEYKDALEVKTLLVKSVAEEQKKKQEELHKEIPHHETPHEETPPGTEGTEGQEALAKAVYGEKPVTVVRDTLSFQPGSYMELLSASQAAPEVEAELAERALQEKVLELWRDARDKQLNGLKNILADGVGLIVFAALVYFGRQQLTSIRVFSNRAFLNFSDPAKVFLFILITDLFVGFHSVEGWEVLLGGVLSHLGLPEGEIFINSFIATVPVIIDACVKFWIFSYLTRLSPSTSAIYERMNT